MFSELDYSLCIGDYFLMEELFFIFPWETDIFLPRLNMDLYIIPTEDWFIVCSIKTLDFIWFQSFFHLLVHDVLSIRPPVHPFIQKTLPGAFAVCELLFSCFRHTEEHTDQVPACWGPDHLGVPPTKGRGQALLPLAYPVSTIQILGVPFDWSHLFAHLSVKSPGSLDSSLHPPFSFPLSSHYRLPNSAPRKSGQGYSHSPPTWPRLQTLPFINPTDHSQINLPKTALSTAHTPLKNHNDFPGPIHQILYLFDFSGKRLLVPPFGSADCRPSALPASSHLILQRPWGGHFPI